MEIQRTFLPGDRWVYFQLYCSPSARDILIASFLKVVSQELYRQKLIEKWFFIRYDAPDCHLRVRFLTVSDESVWQTMAIVNHEMRHWVNLNIVWKATIETYSRELERYGPYMNLAESIFSLDSNCACELISQINGSENKEEVRWRSAILSLTSLLEDFQLSVEKKIIIANLIYNTYLNEYDSKTLIQKAIDEKYRVYKKEINSLFSHGCNFDMEPARTLILGQSSARRKLIEESGCDSHSEKNNVFLGSLMHMLCNRIFASDHRLHEIVMYSFLFKKYRYDLNMSKIAVSLAQN